MSDRAFNVGVFVLAIGASAVGALFMHTCQKERVRELVETARAAEVQEPTPAADVATAVRAMKLVSVEIDTAVTVERGDESWRGDVKAKIRVPVRLLYGTDLSKMRSDGVTFGIGGKAKGVYVIRIPAPERIATEMRGSEELSEVETGWLRLRSRAGEYYLSEARKNASDAAKGLALRPEDAARVDEVTREQVARMVKGLLGSKAEGVDVVVRIDR